MELSDDSGTADALKRAFLLQKSGIPDLFREPLRHRRSRLLALRAWIHSNRSAIHAALYQDFQKPAAEVDGTEIFHVLSEIKSALSHLDAWARPRNVRAPLAMLGTRSSIRYEPKGVCLILAPWNYPFSLCAGPLVSALAAGNAVILKPSELTPAVSALVKRMAEEVFEGPIVTVFEGGEDVARRLLQLPFDHIFFTGSPAVGKVVMHAAAEHLASVTLELGGKSPVVVTASARVREAAQRIAVGKFVNAGQTCIAPDYVLVEASVADAFVAVLTEEIRKLFAGDGSFELSGSYGRIVNDRHFTRLQEWVTAAVDAGARLAFGGPMDRASRFIHPVVLTHVPADAQILQAEIFGPVLPILVYNVLDEAIRFIQSHPKPLALYAFTQDDAVAGRILGETSSGGACINDCAIHFLHEHLPFGGVNTSGIGKAHGHYGFLAFSNEKPVLYQRNGFTTISLFYPPYSRRSQRLMDWFLKLF